MEIGSRRAGPAAGIRRDLYRADAFLLGAVMVRAGRQARHDRRSFQMGEKDFGKTDGHIAHAPFGTVIGARAAPARFQLLEIGRPLSPGSGSVWNGHTSEGWVATFGKASGMAMKG
jgi:hypothetical protein